MPPLKSERDYRQFYCFQIILQVSHLFSLRGKLSQKRISASPLYLKTFCIDSFPLFYLSAQAITGKDPNMMKSGKQYTQSLFGSWTQFLIYFPALIEFTFSSSKRQNLHLYVIPYPTQFVFTSVKKSHR